MKRADAVLVTVLLSTVCLTTAAHALGMKIKNGEQIVSIGDSITAAGGYLRDMDTVFATQYPKMKVPKVINVGISGQKAEDLVGRFDNDVVKKKPAIVTIDIGINDVWHRLGAPHDPKILEAYKMNVSKMVDAAKAAKIRVVLCTPTVITEDLNAEGNKRLAMYCDAVRQIAKDKKCMLADLHEAFAKAIAAKPADAKGNAFTSDGVHMNSQGDWLMAECILTTLGVPQSKINAAKK